MLRTLPRRNANRSAATPGEVARRRCPRGVAGRWSMRIQRGWPYKPPSQAPKNAPQEPPRRSTTHAPVMTPSPKLVRRFANAIAISTAPGTKPMATPMAISHVPLAPCGATPGQNIEEDANDHRHDEAEKIRAAGERLRLRRRHLRGRDS